MKPETEQEYLLGVNQQELERLQFQHRVWKSVTDNFFDRLNVQRGWNCLDVGGGPGFVAMDLRERVGEKGSVTMLEPSQYYFEWFQRRVEEQQWTNVHAIQGTAETAQLPKEQFDLIFVRWVLSFVPDPELFILSLKKALKSGGRLAIQDYYYEGLSLYPPGAFNTVADIMRAYYRSKGGDAYIAGMIPSLFRKNNIRLLELTPHCLAGGPDSDITEWAGQFFTMHLPIMAEKGVLAREQCDAILADWREHRNSPDMLFISPIVVDIAGVKS
ncbi:MAG: methyltransferase domain-containing protein [Bacteroidetes bacterium]|nr:MAG: methyltransferase domain-containing protein [Bacteroidota bacterium]